MAWVNLFDLGECTVKVYDPIFEVFSQVMAKGDTVTFERFNPNDSSVTIGNDGLVTLDGEVVNSSGVMIGILPSYAHDEGRRIRASTFTAEMVDSLGRGGISTLASSGAGTPGVDYVDYDSIYPDATPDPLVLTALSGQDDGLFVYASGGIA